MIRRPTQACVAVTRERVQLAVVAVLVAAAALVAVATPPASAQGTLLASGTADANGNAGPRWQEFDWRPAASGPAELTLSWSGSAMLRIAVYQSDGTWVAANTSTSKPKTVTANVTSGQSYKITVWAMWGSSQFEVRGAGNLTEISSGSLNSGGNGAPRWVGTEWSPSSTGNATIEVRWSGSADVDLGVRDAAGNWVTGATGGARPKSVRTWFRSDQTYTIGVWADSGGSANYSLRVSDAGTPVSNRPNILIVMTDDQRRDSMVDMPLTRGWLGGGGTTFTQGFVSTPSCCPARATAMSGQYVHNHGTINQSGPAFDESQSLQAVLKRNGYRTGHIGKYVHYYDLAKTAPHWDRWTYLKGGYWNMWMNFDGRVARRTGYTTNILFDRAIDYVRGWEANDNDPWMMQVNTTAPHRIGNEVAQVHPDYQNAPISKWNWDLSTFESDRSDKPPFIYCCNINSGNVGAWRTSMLRALKSVDAGVDKLLKELRAKGELNNTLIIFTSDNGWLFGDHNLHEKFLPYDNSVGVPFLMRWDGHIAAGATDDRFVGNVDLAPTVLSAAGIAVPRTMDGIDILSGKRRDRRFTEYFQDNSNIRGIPNWASITTTNYQYTEYYWPGGGIRFRELYYLKNDPYQLNNVLADGNPRNDPDPGWLRTLSSRVANDRKCSGSACP